MRLRPEQLEQQLAGELAPVYLIIGDEPLLIQEAADAVRARARSAGFSDRELFHADGNRFDWNQLLNEASSLSLFAERKLLEVRLPSGKPGKEGGQVLEVYCANINPDNLLLLISGKIDGTGLRSKWVRALDAAGILVQIWPVTSAQMPRWIGERLHRAGIRASRQAAEILADRVEGNLLAAAQEIEKLKLLAPTGEVDASTMSSVVADSARFNVFNLVDRILDGDSQAAARHLRGLREEGIDATVILWAIARDLRTLIDAEEAHRRGGSLETALRSMGVWDRRLPLVKAALRRLQGQQLRILLRQAGAVDRAIKGMRTASPWEELTSLVLSAAGSPPLTTASLRLSLADNRAG